MLFQQALVTGQHRPAGLLGLAEPAGLLQHRGIAFVDAGVQVPPGGHAGEVLHELFHRLDGPSGGLVRFGPLPQQRPAKKRIAQGAGHGGSVMGDTRVRPAELGPKVASFVPRADRLLRLTGIRLEDPDHQMNEGQVVLKTGRPGVLAHQPFPERTGSLEGADRLIRVMGV